MAPPVEKLVVPVAHGGLEARLHPVGAPGAAAVVCHPHPLHGGTLGNNVAYRLARGLQAAGIAALRFNFRGVGASTGSYAGGVGEEEDVVAALDLMQARFPALPLWIAGFSFGSRVGLAVGAREARVERLLGVGLALRLYDYGFLASSPKPRAIVQADGDEFGGEAEIRPLVEGWSGPRHLEIVPASGHLFDGRLDALEAAIARAIAFLQQA